MQLKTKQIVGSPGGPHLLITGGVHGDEFEPMAAVRRLIREVSTEALRGTLTLVPVVNEPAFLRGHRTAEDELDLARTCPGRPDGSVTERIAHALSEMIRAADYYIDLHTGGTGLCVLPLAGYTMHPDEAVLAAQRDMARAFNLPVVWGTDPTLKGRSLSVARDAGVPAIYAEYLGSARCSAEGVEAYVDGCLNVMGMLGMIQRIGPPSRIEHLVEDVRKNSGYLQICNPAPITGFFEPAVELGQAVRVGEPLGMMTDVLGTNTVTIRSQQTGIVLVLTTFSRVKEGDSVAVVLDTQPAGQA